MSDSASLTGSHQVTIGANTIVHPRSKLSSAYGPVRVGSSCIISERSTIGLPTELLDHSKDGVTLEDGVVVEVGAVVEARIVGEGSLIEINAKIGRNAVLGKHCRIGPLCEVAEGETLPDFTVVFGDGLRKVENSGFENVRLKLVGRQIDVLRKLIPSNPAKFQ